MAVLRSLLFYPLFYGFSAVLVIASVFASLMGRSAVAAVVNLWGRWHRWCVTHVLGITVILDGEVPEGAYLIAVKHESYFEAIDMPYLFNFPAVFAKRELFLIPGWGYSAKIYGLIPVARDKGAKALRQMISTAKLRVDEGRPLVIFPEGTRVDHGDAPPLQSGFAGLYKLLALPVVPVAVDSGPLYHGVIKQRGTITYRVGEAIPAGLPRREIEQRVHHGINAVNLYSINCFDPNSANREFEFDVEVSGGRDGETIRCVGATCLMGKGSWPVCRLTTSFRGEDYTSDESDFFAALQKTRSDFLEPLGVIPQCYGASTNVWPSGMARDMGLGMSGYVMELGVQATKLVRIFETGPDVQPTTVSNQSEFANNWFKTLKQAVN